MNLFRKKETIEEEYKESLKTVLGIFENSPNLSMEFENEEKKKEVIPRLKVLHKLELAMDAKEGNKRLVNPRTRLLKMVLDKNLWKYNQEDKNKTWEILKDLIKKRYEEVESQK